MPGIVHRYVTAGFVTSTLQGQEKGITDMSDQKTTFTQEEVDKLLAEKTTGIRAELTSVRAEKEALKTELDGMKTRLESLESDKKKSEADKERMAHESKGEYDIALKKAEDTYNAKLAEITKQTADLKSQLSKHRIDNVILAEASGKVIDGKAGQVVTLIKSEYKIAEKDDGSVEIMTSDGKPVLDKETGKSLDLKGLTGMYLNDNPHLIKPATQGGSGSKAIGQSAGVDLSALSPAEQRAKAREMGITK